MQEIGFQQVSELLPIAGIDYVGLLPAEVQQVSIVSAAIATKATAPSAAKALIEYWRPRRRQPLSRRQGSNQSLSPPISGNHED